MLAKDIKPGTLYATRDSGARAANNTTQQQVKVIGRGFAGWIGVHWSWTGPTAADLAGLDGAYVYDAEHLLGSADHAGYVAWVLSGPMLDPALPPDGERRFSECSKRIAARMLPGLKGAYKTLAEAATDPQAGYTGLDFVGVDTWFKLLREAVPGAKVGRVQGGVIVWE